MKGLLRFGVALVAIGVLVLWGAHSAGPQQLPLLALTKYLPYPLYLAPVLVACLASLWLTWWWRGVALVSLGLTLTVLMGLAWGTPDEGHGRVRFMTYNIKSYLALQRPGGVAELAQEVNEHQPDILVMQDASQLASAAQDGPDVVKQVVGSRHVHHFGQYIVASRWPLRGCQVGGIPILGKSHGFVHCRVVVEGEGGAVELNVVTVHLISPRDGLNAARREGIGGLDEWQENMLSRLQQAGLLAEHLRHIQGPIVLGGDLNAPETSVVLRTLMNTGLRNAFSSAGRGYGHTHGHSLIPGLSFLRIDHILVSEDIGVVDAFAGGATASQHRPVIADLLLHRQR